MNTSLHPLAYVIRGNTPEAVHFGSIAVVDEHGQLTHAVGEPDKPTAMRSSVKPFQALPLLMSGGFDHYKFTPKQLAIMCASHNGTDEHVAVVQSNLDAAENTADDLQCGTHWPTGMKLNEEYPCKGEDKDPLRHNCSGKHSGFLALARFIGEDVKEYLNPESSTQKLIIQAVADMCEYPVDKIDVSIDGCSAPQLSIPPLNLAIGFKNLAIKKGNSDLMTKAVERVYEAMNAFPKLVSGERRYDYDFMRSFPGNVVCKIGAEAVEGMGFSEQKIGIAVKITDGNTRALWPVCVEVLRQLDIVDNIENFPFLKRYDRNEQKNYRGLETGRIEAKFELKKV
jgi:L-asparaginase II